MFVAYMGQNKIISTPRIGIYLFCFLKISKMEKNLQYDQIKNLINNIKSKVKPSDVLQRHGTFDYSNKQKQYCIFCDKKSLKYNDEFRLFTCQNKNCAFKGDIIEFYAYKMNLNLKIQQNLMNVLNIIIKDYNLKVNDLSKNMPLISYGRALQLQRILKFYVLFNDLTIVDLSKKLCENTEIIRKCMKYKPKIEKTDKVKIKQIGYKRFLKFYSMMENCHNDIVQFTEHEIHAWDYRQDQIIKKYSEENIKKIKKSNENNY